MKEREALKLALDALKIEQAALAYEHGKVEHIENAITAAEEALAQPEQEPVAWQERQAKRMQDGVVTEWTNWYPCRYRTIDEAKAEACDHIPYEWRPLYTTPPQRKPLTDELWDLLDAVEKELNRRAIPEAWLLVAHKAGRAYIEARGIKE